MVDYSEKRLCVECNGDSWYDLSLQCEVCEGTGMRPFDDDEIVYVNVYSVTRHYGGAEEGGWWFDWKECIEVYPTRYKNAGIVADELEAAHEDKRWGDISSVLGGEDIRIRIEVEPKASESKEVPRYE